MVYFGNRRFKGATPGLKPADKGRLVFPFLLLVGVGLVYGFLQIPSGPRPGELPAEIAIVPEGRATSEGGAETIRTSFDDPVADILEVPPVEDPNRDPDPFRANPLMLSAVQDEGDPESPVTLASLSYLFHRWRAGEAQPVQPEFPSIKRLRELAPTMRGNRYTLYLEPDLAPFPRDLQDNPSGVARYWEVWAHDSQGLYRVLFLDKNPDQLIAMGTEWRVEADFHRLHRYERADGHLAAVPEFVAHRFEAVETAQVDTDWTPLLVAGAIALLGVVVIGVLWVRQERRPPRRFVMSSSRAT